MFRLNKLVKLAIITCLLASSPGRAGGGSDNTPRGELDKIVILHTNDLHFDFNHQAEIARTVAEFRAAHDNVFLLDAGDIFVRHRHRWPLDCLEFYEHRTRFMIETMNELGYDAAVLGNHELDYKSTITRDSLRLARFPLLGANLEVSTENFDQPLPYTILETTHGHTIAVLGLTTGRAPGIRATDPVEVIRQHWHVLHEHSVRILLTHLGYRADRELARQFGQLDLIIGGHSHTQLDPAREINHVLVAQTGGHPHQIDPVRRQYLGVIRIWLENGKVVDQSGEVMTFTETPRNSSASPARAGLEAKTGTE